MRELQSLVGYGRSGPAIDPVFGSLSLNFWASTSYESRADHAWIINFSDGAVDYANEAGSGTSQSSNSRYGS